MKTAVIGAGAIGGLVAGYLKLKGEDVVLAGHSDAVSAIKKGGLQISGARGNFNIDINASESLDCNPDLAILATKTQDVEASIKDNLRYLEKAAILTTQNGVEADAIVSKYIPRENAISSIVMFGATYLEPGKVVHNFEGDWILGSLGNKDNAGIARVSEALNKSFPVVISEDIRGMKYLKIFLNANNCIPAVLGMSMQEVFSDINISRIAMAIWREGINIISRCGINLVSLPDFPLERLTKLTSLPLNEAARIYSGIMANLSKEPLYGSILQSIKRGRSSEIDYLNGEFLRLAEGKGLAAPLNKELVKMVHQVEKTENFFSKEEFLKQTEGLVN